MNSFGPYARTLPTLSVAMAVTGARSLQFQLVIASAGLKLAPPSAVRPDRARQRDPASRWKSPYPRLGLVSATFVSRTVASDDRAAIAGMDGSGGRAAGESRSA